jgi:hypothetical protein
VNNTGDLANQIRKYSDAQLKNDIIYLRPENYQQYKSVYDAEFSHRGLTPTIGSDNRVRTLAATPPPSPPLASTPGTTGQAPGPNDPITGKPIPGGPPTGLTGNNPDQGIINATGQQQYGQTQQFIAQDADARAVARSALAKALTGQLEDQFKFSLPGTLEDLNAGHLLTSSALPQEIARQQGNIAAQVAGQTGVLGAQDIATTSAQRAAALQNLQGFGTAGINRNFSLADFEKQSQLAQTLGAQAAPQVGGGKGAVGTGLSGLGVAAPLAGLAFPGAAPALLATGAASSAAANNARGSGK